MYNTYIRHNISTKLYTCLFHAVRLLDSLVPFTWSLKFKWALVKMLEKRITSWFFLQSVYMILYIIPNVEIEVRIYSASNILTKHRMLYSVAVVFTTKMLLVAEWSLFSSTVHHINFIYQILWTMGTTIYTRFGLLPGGLSSSLLSLNRWEKAWLCVQKKGNTCTLTLVSHR